MRYGWSVFMAHLTGRVLLGLLALMGLVALFEAGK